jgi:hypothetical protein
MVYTPNSDILFNIMANFYPWIEHFHPRGEIKLSEVRFKMLFFIGLKSFNK